MGVCTVSKAYKSRKDHLLCVKGMSNALPHIQKTQPVNFIGDIRNNREDLLAWNNLKNELHFMSQHGF